MTFKNADLDRLAGIVAEAADREIMPRFRSLASGHVREKASALDLVTDADEAAEWLIRDEVKRAFPQALFVGEESVERDRSLLGGIGDADLAIVVDPVDGTSNFAWGLPLFGVIVAVVAKGETVAGLIYDPVGRDWLKAVKGEGAWAETHAAARRRLAVAPAAPLAELTGVSSWYLMAEPQRARTVASLARVRAAFSYRCAAYEYRMIAEGFVHFALHPKLMPWDHAAGVLIHAEAGGYSACFDGRPYSPARSEGGIISAPDRATWTALRDALIG